MSGEAATAGERMVECGLDAILLQSNIHIDDSEFFLFA